VFNKSETDEIMRAKPKDIKINRGENVYMYLVIYIYIDMQPKGRCLVVAIVIKRIGKKLLLVLKLIIRERERALLFV
jgi:hypothetical protein